MGRVTSGWGDSRFTESGYLESYSAGRGNRAADETLMRLDSGEYELVESMTLRGDSTDGGNSSP